MIDFKNIEYLKEGTEYQKKAYNELIWLEVFDNLSELNPLLAGTIPIGIHLPESDLDIICECYDHRKFIDRMTVLYGMYNNFQVNTTCQNGMKSTVVSFDSRSFAIEIFAQDQPSALQNAYRHMLIEYKILIEKDESFRLEIINLKKSGLKTEPAFAQLLGLKGNPYEALLKLEESYIM